MRCCFASIPENEKPNFKLKIFYYYLPRNEGETCVGNCILYNGVDICSKVSWFLAKFVEN